MTYLFGGVVGVYGRQEGGVAGVVVAVVIVVAGHLHRLVEVAGRQRRELSNLTVVLKS